MSNKFCAVVESNGIISLHRKHHRIKIYHTDISPVLSYTQAVDIW
jgi:hypothetical protein